MNRAKPANQGRRTGKESISNVGNYASLDLALGKLWKFTKLHPRTEMVSSRDSFGRVAAETTASPINIPDRPRSHMDGFALAASDLLGATSKSPRVLRLVGNPKTALSGSQKISTGQTMKVVTGGPLPAGTDSVVPVEETVRIGNRISFAKEVRKGEFSFPTGVDVRKGRTILQSGATIRAQDVGVLVHVGVDDLRVFARPRIAIVATGSELSRKIGASDPFKVRESHSPIFESLVTEVGGTPSFTTIVPDDVTKIAAIIDMALKESDMVMTLGGTSLGEKDLVERALRKISKQSRIVHGIKMDRGRVAGLAEVRGKPVVMLPGPAQGAMNAFVLLALPVILKLAGVDGSHIPRLGARLETGWRARNRFADFTKVLYVSLQRIGGTLYARPIIGETESISVLTDSDGFVVVPEKTRKMRAGDEVSVRLLPGFSYVGIRFPSG